jgi:hypothetical protein
MRKLRLPLLLLALVLSFVALPVQRASAGFRCLCDIVCWDSGTQRCWQDDCCQVHCCDADDPSCWPPC